jgi:hypothetical protein
MRCTRNLGRAAAAHLQECGHRPLRADAVPAMFRFATVKFSSEGARPAPTAGAAFFVSIVMTQASNHRHAVTLARVAHIF